MSNYLVGLTGGIGSGKSTVADLFVARGAGLVDTDVIAHQLTAPGGDALPAIVAVFGTDILDEHGAMNRQRMREHVFADPGARNRLEAILHPLIRTRSLSACTANPAPYVILAVPLLVESGAYRQHCDRILVIDCPETVQIARVRERSGLNESEVRRILSAQASRDARLAVADDVVVNDKTAADLAPTVDKLHAEYLAAAAKKAQANC